MKKIFSLLFLVSVCVSAMMAHPSRMYLIGSATSAGWSLDNAALMVTDSDGVYEWIGDLNDGELKFLETPNWMPSYGPAANGDSLASGAMTKRVEELQDNDNKYAVAAGRYSIHIDLTGENPQLTVADGTGLEDKGYSTYYPEVLYAIGNATLAGWTIEDAIEMRETAFNSGLYRAKFALHTGELKFLKQRNWGAGFGATVANDSVYDAGVYSIAALDDSDKKFAVALTEETEFEVEVSAVDSTMTLTVAYPEHMYIIGTAVGGWSWDDNAQAMTMSEEGVFTWEGTLLGGEMKFFVEKDFGVTSYGAATAGQEIATIGEYPIEKLDAEDKKFIAPTDASVALTLDLKQKKLFVAPYNPSAIELVGADDVVYIYDMMGALRMRTTADAVNTGLLSTGVYIMKGNNVSQKIVIKQ